MPTPNWVENPTAWSLCSLGGEVWPATCKIKGDPGVDIDVKQAKGSDGPTITDNGTEATELSLAFEFVPQFYAKIEELINGIDPARLGADRNPMSIEFAPVNARGINTIKIRKISLIEVDDKGLGSFTITAIRWVPQPKKTKPSAAKPKVEANPARDPWMVPPLISLLNKQPITDQVDPTNQFTDPADVEWMRQLQNGV